MKPAGERHVVPAAEDLLARSLAQHVARHCAILAKRPIRPDDILIRRYLAARPTVTSDATHDLVVIVAPREISAAIVAQVKAFGPTAPLTDRGRDG